MALVNVYQDLFSMKIFAWFVLFLPLLMSITKNVHVKNHNIINQEWILWEYALKKGVLIQLPQILI